MSKEYDLLLEKICSYVTMNQVVSDSQIISMWDLYCKVNQEFEELRKIYDFTDFKEEVNLANTTYKTVGFLFKKTVPVLEHTCIFISCAGYAERSSIHFSFLDNTSQDEFGVFTSGHSVQIHKDFDSSEPYFDKYCIGHKFATREFVETHYERIMEIFTTLEKFMKLTGKPIPWTGFYEEDTELYSVHFDCDIFDIKITCQNQGGVLLNVSLNDQADPNHLYDRKWVNSNCLADFVQEHLEEILSRIPVSISTLDPVFATIVQNQNQLTKKI